MDSKQRRSVRETPDPKTGGKVKHAFAEGHVIGAGGSGGPVKAEPLPAQEGIKVTERAAVQQVVRDFAEWLKLSEKKLVVGAGYDPSVFDLEVAAYINRVGSEEIYPVDY
ncbi:MAG: hypothetical protein ACI88C_000030 [Acidimicrobiales bacterium]|jgi:hypothetical protein